MSSENHQKFQRPVQWNTMDLFNVSGDLYTAPVLDSEDDRIVVRKVQIAKYTPEEEANALFKKLEDRVKFLQTLSHPNLLKYLGTAKKGRTLYILSECAGHSYKSPRFKKQKKFPELEHETRKITHQLLLGLEFLHEQKIVHGNIKLENIFVDGNGNVKLADFGLSKELTAATAPMGAEGNPQFKTDHNLTADERHWLDGKIADVRNVGRIVVEMLKRKPWSARLEKSIKAELPSPGRNFIVKCLTWLPDSKVEISDLIQDPFITPQVGNTGLLQTATKAFQDTVEAAKQTGYTMVGNAVETAKQTGYKAVENAFEAAKQTGNKAVETAAQTSHTAGHIAGVAARNGIKMTDEFGKGYREGKGESGDEEQKQHAAPKAEDEAKAAAKRKHGEKVSHSGPKVVKNEAKFAPAAKPILTRESLQERVEMTKLKTEKRPCCMFSCCYF